MKLLCSLVLSASFFVGAAQAANPGCADDARYPEISYKDLKAGINDGSLFVVDVNSNDSYKETHIGSAIHFATNEKNFNTMLPKNKDAKIVAYCGGVSCTAWKKAAMKACEAGYTHVFHFKEGISGWKKLEKGQTG